MKLFRNITIALSLLLCANMAQAAGGWKAKHVILIGFDGWAAHDFDKYDMPTVKELKANGSFTLKKRSVLPSSSAQNWSSMFKGAGVELHGVLENDEKPQIEPRVVTKNGMFPDIFYVLREAYPKAEIGSTYSWTGLEHTFDNSVLSFLKVSGNEEELCNEAVKYIKEKKPAFAFFYFDAADSAGHGLGWYTQAYFDTVAALDKYVKRIVEAVKEAGIYDDTIFILSSDHGGTGRAHSGSTIMEMESPFIISGKNVKKGYEIQGSMMQYDIAATIAAIFNVKQPQVWVGRPVTEVFTK